MIHAPPAARPEEAGSAGRTGVLAMESLARAARQIALYGPHHPIAASALHEAWTGLSRLVNGGDLALQVEETGLRWNGEPMVEGSVHVQRLHQALRDRLVATVKLNRAVELSGLGRLLQLLAEDAQLLLSTGGLMQALGPDGAGGLLVEDLDFKRDLQQCEAAWIEVCQEIDPQAVEPLRHILETCLHLVRSVGEHRTLEEIRSSTAQPAPFDPTESDSPTTAIAMILASLLQSAGEIALNTGSANFQRWQASVLSQLERLGPAWRAHVFRCPAPASEGSPDVLALLTQQMAFESRLSLVLDYPGSIVTERSEGLALLLQRLLSHREEAVALERGLHARAVAQGIAEQVYRNVVGMLLPELSKRKGDSGHRLLEGGAELSADPKVELADLFGTLVPRAVRRSRAHMLLDLLDAEVNASQYAAIVKGLVESLQQAVRLGEGELLISILTRLLRDLTEEGARSTGRRAIAEGALQRSVNANLIALLGREMERRPAEERTGLIEVLGQLGDLGLEALMDLARASHRLEAREAIRVLAERDAPAYSNLRHLLSELPVVDLERALRTLLQLSLPHVASQINAAAVHVNPHARRALIRAVEETQNPEGAAVVVSLLGDPLPEIRAVAAALLGQLRVPEAVPGLCYLLGRESDFRSGAAVKEAAAAALGRIGAPEAIPALAEFLFGGGLLARFARPGPRAAAVEALRRIGTPEARRPLEHWRRCRQPAVRDLCLHTLRDISRSSRYGLRGEGGHVS